MPGTETIDAFNLIRRALEPETAKRSARTGSPGRRDAPPTLRETIERARQAAWKGRRIERFLPGIEFASAGDCSLVFLDGEYVGEVAQDPTAREQALPHGFLRVYQDFNPRRRFHYVSDPRRFAPSFRASLGRFPSRETAALALLEALGRDGKLARFERSWGTDDGTLERVKLESASMASPWFRVSFDGRELGWVLVDRKRANHDARWYYLGPPALEPRRRCGFYTSRNDAAAALVEAVRAGFERDPERFDAAEGFDPSGLTAWNHAAADLARAMSGDERPTPAQTPVPHLPVAERIS